MDIYRSLRSGERHATRGFWSGIVGVGAEWQPFKRAGIWARIGLLESQLLEAQQRHPPFGTTAFASAPPRKRSWAYFAF